MTNTKVWGLAGAAVLLGACATPGMITTPAAPAAVSVPAGHSAVMIATGIGELTYECRAKANSADAFEWAFTGPNAILYSSQKVAIGRYYGGPTWEANDGSKVTGKQISTAPGTPNAIPLQLVKADAAVGSGVMTGVTYIQRLNTIGGVAPGDACTAANLGARQLVKYQADYVFYKAS